MSKRDKKVKRSIPERPVNISFDPSVVRADIKELESLEKRGEISSTGYAELHLLRVVEEAQKMTGNGGDKERKTD